jgi:hypothetical protein
MNMVENDALQRAIYLTAQFYDYFTMLMSFFIDVNKRGC